MMGRWNSDAAPQPHHQHGRKKVSKQSWHVKCAQRATDCLTMLCFCEALLAHRPGNPCSGLLFGISGYVCQHYIFETFPVCELEVRLCATLTHVPEEDIFQTCPKSSNFSHDILQNDCSWKNLTTMQTAWYCDIWGCYLWFHWSV